MIDKFDRAYYSRNGINKRFRQIFNELDNTNISFSELDNIRNTNISYNRGFNKFLIISSDYSGFHVDKFNKK